MSEASTPTVVLNSIEFSGGRNGYRVIFCNGADVFGADGEHVAETFAESRADVLASLLELEVELHGWDAVDVDDREALWQHRPEELSRSARHFAGAILEDAAIPDGGDESPRKRENDAGIPESDCGHPSEYKIDGECLRYAPRFNTSEEREVQSGLVKDVGGGLQ